MQHVELCRDYAIRFNQLFCSGDLTKTRALPVPKPSKSEFGKVMSLRDASAKMSKSNKSENSRISLRDSPEAILTKIQKAKTDSIPTVNFDPKNRPELANLLRIYASLSDIPVSEAESQFIGSSIPSFKEQLARKAVEKICPIGEKIESFLETKQELLELLEIGRQKASEEAQANLKEIRELMGILPRHLKK